MVMKTLGEGLYDGAKANLRPLKCSSGLKHNVIFSYMLHIIMLLDFCESFVWR